MAFKWFIGQNQSIFIRKQVFNDFWGGDWKQRSDNGADGPGDTAQQPFIKQSVWEPVLGAMISFHVRFNSLSFAASGA